MDLGASAASLSPPAWCQTHVILCLVCYFYVLPMTLYPPSSYKGQAH
jgi:hypothetical protein